MVALNLVYPFLIGREAVIGEGTWNNRLVPNRKKGRSRLFIVTLLN